MVRAVFASTGIIRTVAGNGYGAAVWANRVETGYTGAYTGDGGAATSAEFFGTYGFTIDSQGNMSIADLFNKVVRQVSATAAGYIFPPTQVGLTSASQIYTLSNIGTQTVTLSALTVSAKLAQVPSGLTDCTATTNLPPGGTCQLALEFAPTTIGLLNGHAQLTYNLGAQTIQLSGVGIVGPSDDVLESIAVTPTTSSVAQGATQSYIATATYSGGGTQDVTTSVTWTSSTPSIATIGIGSGVATGVGTGMTQITATAGAISSSPVMLTVTPAVLASFIVTSPTGPQAVEPGGSAQFTITVTAQNGTYSNAVTLSASDLPNGATATFMPPSVTPGSSSASSTLTIQTAQAAAVQTAKDSRSPFAGPSAGTHQPSLLPGRRRRRWITSALLLLASLGAFTALTACGGGFRVGGGRTHQHLRVTPSP